MKTYQVYQVDAFTKDKFKGNPAGVVLNADGLSETQMLSIARELNNSETAFLFSPTSADHDVWVRFFTPSTEVPSCGHATISAHYVRALENQLPSGTVIQKIGIGLLPVEITREEQDCRMVMTQGEILFGEPFTGKIHDDIVAALGLTPVDMDERCPIQIVSTGHSKVLIGIKSQQTLHTLQPNHTRLTEISQDIHCNGYYVFTLDTTGDVLTTGRMFAPAIGITEDPVTGNANGPLGAYLVHHKLVEVKDSTFSFKGEQGVAIGRRGVVDVKVLIEDDKPKTVQVGGQAVVAFKTEITI